MLQDSYLIAIALFEQEEKRFMPIGGKSLKKPFDKNNALQENAGPLIQQLLLRVFQKTEQGPIKRAYSDKSLLIIQIPMNLMQEKIPVLKGEWVKSGNSKKFLAELKTICEGIWAVTFTKETGMTFKSTIKD